MLEFSLVHQLRQTIVFLEYRLCFYDILFLYLSLLTLQKYQFPSSSRITKITFLPKNSFGQSTFAPVPKEVTSFSINPLIFFSFISEVCFITILFIYI